MQRYLASFLDAKCNFPVHLRRVFLLWPGGHLPIRLIGVKIEFLRPMNAEKGLAGGRDRKGNPITKLPVGSTSIPYETHPDTKKPRLNIVNLGFARIARILLCYGLSLSNYCH
jgi:hypothetical protein